MTVKATNGKELQHAATKVALSTSVSLKVGNEVIGTIQSFNPGDTRPTVRVRGIGSEKVYEIVPGFVDTNISVTKFALYTQNMLKAFGFANARTLVSTGTPFDMEEVTTIPIYDSTGKLIDVRTESTIYKGCVLSNYSRSVTIGGQLIIVEQATIAVAEVV